jgi:hypothetical protein
MYVCTELGTSTGAIILAVSSDSWHVHYYPFLPKQLTVLRNIVTDTSKLCSNDFFHPSVQIGSHTTALVPSPGISTENDSHILSLEAIHAVQKHWILVLAFLFFPDAMNVYS